MKKYLVLTILSIVAACAPDVKVNTIVNSKDNPLIIPPKCPDWSVGNNVNYSNTPSSNYGCANINNYGAMIEDPNDMIVGKSTYLSSGARSATPVTSYEAGGTASTSGSSSSSSSSSSGSSPSQ
jgi:pilus assembly protein CpaD